MGHHPYWAIGPHVICEMGFSANTALDPHPLHARRFPEFLSTHKVFIAGREVSCGEWQYLGRHVHAARIACVGSEHELYIHFDGDIRKTPLFYEFLQHNISEVTGERSD